MAVNVVRIVQRKEPIPAAARVPPDDCVNTLGCAPVSLPQFCAGLEAAPEHGVVVLKQPALVVDDESVAFFENIHRPTERIHKSDIARLVEEKLTRSRH